MQTHKPSAGPKEQPIPFTRVTIDDSFWSSRLKTNRERTIPFEYAQCKRTGRIDAFRLDWTPEQTTPPHIFWDSDVAKWIEAASYSLATSSDPDLDALLDEVVALIASAQQPDGYLNVHFTVVEPEKRWTNLRDAHELYCAGHLIEAAVAHYQATGKRSLLDVLQRYADHIAATFGRDPGQRRGYPGHPEIELALVKLYRSTGIRRYLDLARYFVDERGQQPHYFDLERAAQIVPESRFGPSFDRMYTHEYNQSHRAVREQDRPVGHAVRAMYLYSAMTDLAAELGDSRLAYAVRRLWDHLTNRLLYLTGGIGASRNNEGFTADYDLPNETAYCETCASVGLVFWAHRLLLLDHDRRYGDVLEQALYNGVISGVSLDGQRFFYENPLASDGTHHRQEWFDCACCPPNLARLLASLGGYIYSEGEREIVVHLYVESRARATIAGQDVTVRQETRYPWDGHVRLTTRTSDPVAYSLKMRVPGWCPDATLAVNGETIPVVLDRGYAAITRTWREGDVVDLDLAMPVERVYAHPRVAADAGRVALRRGPIVYCLEGIDHPFRLNTFTLPRDVEIEAQLEPDLLGGVVVLSGRGLRVRADHEPVDLDRSFPTELEPAPFKAVPYCVWDNRSPGEMLVWLREASPIDPGEGGTD